MAKFSAVPPVTDTFEKMGDGGYDQIMNMSGQRSPYTMPVQRQGPTMPDTGGGNGSAHKGRTLISEAHGPSFRPVATRGFAADYAATGRNIRIVPSAVGNRDFWASRQDSYAGEVIH